MRSFVAKLRDDLRTLRCRVMGHDWQESNGSIFEMPKGWKTCRRCKANLPPEWWNSRGGFIKLKRPPINW